MSCYFEAISQEGPTAARCMKRCALGVPLPLLDSRCSHEPLQGHLAQLREPLSLKVVLALCKAGAAATGAKTFLCHVLLMLTACLRYTEVLPHACFLAGHLL